MADDDGDNGSTGDGDTPGSPESGADADVGAGDRGSGSGSGGPSAERLLERIADYDETLAAEVQRIIERGAELHDVVEDLETAVEQREDRIEELESALEDREDRIEELESALEDREDRIENLESELKRKQADFQNYKKRAERKRERIKERATEDLVERLIDVRDDLRRAVENDHPDIAEMRGGVEMTIRKFDRVLDEENVSMIDPDPGEEVDPEYHEVMMRTDSEHPEGAIADVYAPGYEMADRILRPAKVTVSTGNAPEESRTAGTGGETTDGAKPDPDLDLEGDIDPDADIDDLDLDPDADTDLDDMDLEPEADDAARATTPDDED